MSGSVTRGIRDVLSKKTQNKIKYLNKCFMFSLVKFIYGFGQNLIYKCN